MEAKTKTIERARGSGQLRVFGQRRCFISLYALLLTVIVQSLQANIAQSGGIFDSDWLQGVH